MQSKLSSQNGQKIFALIFAMDEEVVSGLTAFVEGTDIESGNFTGSGAFQTVTLGFFDRKRMEYKKILIDEQVEVLSVRLAFAA